MTPPNQRSAADMMDEPRRSRKGGLAERADSSPMQGAGPLTVVPITREEANAFVARVHRHHGPVPGAKFQLAVAIGEDVVGVAIVGRPVARHYDDGWTLEVNRTCTDGSRNANSMLYGASWRAAKALGYRRLITYTQEGESGASLRAAGWRLLAERQARPGWDAPSRPRVNKNDQQTRILWEAV